MGTRAVVHADLHPFGIDKDIWIATHWDGYPEGLGETLKRSLDEEILKVRQNKTTLGGAIEKAVGKACAIHSIDEMSTDGKANFRYGDFAEYLYEIDPTGKLKVKPLTGSWSEHKGKIPTAWKTLKKYSFDKNARSMKQLNKVI